MNILQAKNLILNLLTTTPMREDEYCLIGDILSQDKKQELERVLSQLAQTSYEADRNPNR